MSEDLALVIGHKLDKGFRLSPLEVRFLSLVFGLKIHRLSSLYVSQTGAYKRV